MGVGVVPEESQSGGCRSRGRRWVSLVGVGTSFSFYPQLINEARLRPKANRPSLICELHSCSLDVEHTDVSARVVGWTPSEPRLRERICVTVIYSSKP